MLENTKRVFVVNHEPAVAKTLTALLRLHGYSTRCFTDRWKALTAYHQECPELLLSDVMMPGLTGVELAIRVNAIYPHAKGNLCMYFNGKASGKHANNFTAANGKFISYIRSPKVRKPSDEVALEKQRNAVDLCLKREQWELLQEVVEVEDGRRNVRPQLLEALRLCREHQATLIIAKMDRLARNPHFISTLIDSGVDFIACDFLPTQRLTNHILAAVAEHEVTMMFLRTDSVLKTAAARAAKLLKQGVFEDPVANRKTKRERINRESEFLPTEEENEYLKSALRNLKAQGATSHQEIADTLNQAGYTTARRGPWTAKNIMRLENQARNISSQSINRANSGQKIFVVDDDPVLVTTLTALLSFQGYHVRQFSSSRQALQAFPLECPDLLISDVIMPDGSGVDLAIRVKAMYPDCRVLLISGRVETDDILGSARERGHHFRFLPKPIPSSMLIATVRHSLSSSLDNVL